MQEKKIVLNPDEKNIVNDKTLKNDYNIVRIRAI